MTNGQYGASLVFIGSGLGCWVTAAVLVDLTTMTALPMCLVILGILSFAALTKVGDDK